MNTSPGKFMNRSHQQFCYKCHTSQWVRLRVLKTSNQPVYTCPRRECISATVPLTQQEYKGA